MIISRCKDVEEFKQVHKECANERIASAEGILKNWDYHFCFYTDDGKLVGCIYIEDDDGLTCLSGFARRKSYKIVMNAIKWVSDFMHKDDLYSKTDKKSAIMVLLRSGFTKIDKETYYRKAF